MDEGHNNLILDLVTLLDEARAYEFHDFKNEKYATPKMSLVLALQQLIDNVKEGKYDN